MKFGRFLYSNIATEDMLYTDKDIENSMDKIETINFHQVDLKFPIIKIGAFCIQWTKNVMLYVLNSNISLH